jgi:hypothetical protein
MAGEFSRIDTRAEILRIIGELAHASKEAVAPQGRRDNAQSPSARVGQAVRRAGTNAAASHVTAVTQKDRRRNRFAFFQL